MAMNESKIVIIKKKISKKKKEMKERTSKFNEIFNNEDLRGIIFGFKRNIYQDLNKDFNKWGNKVEEKELSIYKNKSDMIRSNLSAYLDVSEKTENWIVRCLAREPTHKIKSELYFNYYCKNYFFWDNEERVLMRYCDDDQFEGEIYGGRYTPIIENCEEFYESSHYRNLVDKYCKVKKCEEWVWDYLVMCD